MAEGGDGNTRRKVCYSFNNYPCVSGNGCISPTLYADCLCVSELVIEVFTCTGSDPH